MFAQERQQSIAEKIKAEGRVRVAQLAAEFAVTEDCIRKDLTVLEKQGLARKTYGGAVRVRENPHLYSSRDRRGLPDPERLGIVQKAMGIPTSMFTCIFALARTVGWMVQWEEMISDPEYKIGRPRQLYNGTPFRDVPPIHQREE